MKAAAACIPAHDHSRAPKPRSGAASRGVASPGDGSIMNLYNRVVLPRLINLACGIKPIARQRLKIVPQAQGRVLEIGVGSGLNFAYYDPRKVERLWALEPCADIRKLAERKAGDVAFPVAFIDRPAEEIPLEDRSLDTVVTTFTLCTIPDAPAALREMRRVLKPGGQLLFAEHGRAPEQRIRRWQDRLTPLWKRIGGGCHLNRDIPPMIEAAGFCLSSLEAAYLPGPKPLTFNFWGAAVRQ